MWPVGRYIWASIWAPPALSGTQSRWDQIVGTRIISSCSHRHVMLAAVASFSRCWFRA